LNIIDVAEYSRNGEQSQRDMRGNVGFSRNRKAFCPNRGKMGHYDYDIKKTRHGLVSLRLTDQNECLYFFGVSTKKISFVSE
jgi:hypothetical protein